MSLFFVEMQRSEQIECAARQKKKRLLYHLTSDLLSEFTTLQMTIFTTLQTSFTTWHVLTMSICHLRVCSHPGLRNHPFPWLEKDGQKTLRSRRFADYVDPIGIKHLYIYVNLLSDYIWFMIEWSMSIYILASLFQTKYRTSFWYTWATSHDVSCDAKPHAHPKALALPGVSQDLIQGLFALIVATSHASTCSIHYFPCPKWKTYKNMEPNQNARGKLSSRQINEHVWGSVTILANGATLGMP